MRSILKKKDKHGDIISIALFVGFVFAMIISIVVLTKIFNSVSTTLKATDIIANDTKAVTQITKVETSFVPLVSNIFLFIFFGSIFGIIISSFFINTHPGFFIFFLIATIIVIVITAIISNVITSFGESAELVSTWNLYPGIQAIVNNLPLIILVVAIIVAVILFARPGGSSNQA